MKNHSLFILDRENFCDSETPKDNIRQFVIGVTILWSETIKVESKQTFHEKQYRKNNRNRIVGNTGNLWRRRRLTVI